jgi:putative Ca2+/H+ antiporter (TMEM165/GDT1 family)
MGDRTQLLSLLLTTRFRKPLPILSAILLATLANHGVAGAIGVWIGRYLTPAIVDVTVGASMLAMALWTLKADVLEDQKESSGRSAFLTTLVAFFIAEMGDKTQIATVALAAGYANLFAVVAGTTAGMMLANIPVVLLGNAFATRLPLRTIHYVASGLFVLLGILFLARGIGHIRGT